MGQQVKCAKCGEEFHEIYANMPCPYCGEAQTDAEGEILEPLHDETDQPTAVGSSAATEPARRPCPMCGEMIPEQALKCRFCGTVFDESLRGKLGGGGDFANPAWRTVASGLRMVYLSTVFAVLAFVVVVVMAATAAANAHGRPQMMDGTLGVAILVASVAVFITGICVIIGQVKCVAVPEQSGARGLAIAAIVLLIIDIICNTIGRAIHNHALTGLASLAGIIAVIVFILFIGRTAKFIDEARVARSARSFLVYIGVMFILGILLISLIVTGTMRRSDMAPIAGILGILLLVGSLVGLVWYLRLVRDLGTAIQKRIDG